ncbi:MAG: pyridoxamine 5'-phosphate oxidase [Bacteroidales bacterium]|nr:pyridoxamine 5'-phosphate oxidase [Bacteroidales bacterium]
MDKAKTNKRDKNKIGASLEESLHHMRQEYSPTPLTKENMHRDPLIQFKSWFKEALKHEQSEVNAMVLATANKRGEPSARVLLLKSYSKDGFIFFTNYNSKKGREIEHNNKVSLLFYWPNTMRQIRVEGIAKKIAPQESDQYFNSRPIASQASSALSKQSEPLLEPVEFEKAVAKLENSSNIIERPTHWGGYLVKPHSFEFWQGGLGRSHDRFLYTQQTDIEDKTQNLGNNSYVIKRLYP